MGEGNDESPKREDESPKKRGHGRFVTLWPLLSVINGGMSDCHSFNKEVPLARRPRTVRLAWNQSLVRRFSS